MVVRGLLKEHYINTFARIPIVRPTSIFPIINLRQLKVAIATKTHEQQQQKT